MSFYRNAIYWFCALLVVSVVGFWRTYFSDLGEGTLHITHHIHGIAMLLWVSMLIGQSWLIRTRRNSLHRTLGRASVFLAPVVFLSAIWVNIHFMEGAEAPFPPGLIAVFGYGFFLPIAFAVLYILALVHRQHVQLHARYMAATALVFVQPGLGRALNNYMVPVTGWGPSFFQVSLIPLLIGGWLLLLDWKGDKPLQPYAVVSGLWVGHVAVWVLTPQMQVWQTVAEWAVIAAG